MIAPLTALVAGRQEPVHRANRAVITAFVEQRGIDRGRGHIGEALAVEYPEQQLLLDARECQRGSRPRTQCAPRANEAMPGSIAIHKPTVQPERKR